MATVHATEAGGVRNRSFGGCATCRSRHMKCDEGRPACSVCTSLNVPCGGYEKSIFFDFEESTEGDTVRFRRPLLTEEERKCMSQWLTSVVPPKSALRFISQIDNECEKSIDSQQLEIQRGPFGAFRLNPDENLDLELASTRIDLLPEDLLQVDNYSLSPGDDLVPEWALTELDQRDPLQDFENIMMDLDCDANFVSAFDETTESQHSLIGVPAPKSFQISTFTRPPTPSSNPIFPSTSLSTFSDFVPQDVVLLIKNYSTTILRLITPFRHTKTPWHVLFIPHAKSCLAALTLGEQLDDASLGGLYGILAISALSLAGTSQTKTWQDRGKAYRQQANKHVSLMLKTAYNTPKTAKYKSILMALVTMIQLSMFCGSRDETEYHFLEAEKFIRLRGLKRAKSRKVRLLHHCYAFERMFYESTSTGDTNPIHRDLVRKAVESSGLVIYGQDSMVFHVPTNWNDLEQKMLEIKGREEGENDLHLEQPGVFAATLYPEIFGVPETWMYVVSQIIRLGRAKDASESEDNQGNALSIKAFLTRAKAIERCISKLHLGRCGPATGDRSTEKDDQLESILDAMQHALAIYFYRRVYDVDASMLQQEARLVHDCLLRHEGMDPSQAFGTARLIWPAFIAASEAEDQALQTSFSTWFRNASDRSGLPIFGETLDSLECIWQKKRRLNRKDVTWLSVARETVLVC